MAKKRPRVIRPEKTLHLRGHCGDVIKLISSGERGPLNFDYVSIDYALEHMHKKSTEYYYIARGSGRVYLDGRPL